MALHPLLERLAQLTGASVLSSESLESFEAAPGEAALFFAGDPVRFPEGLDMAVVLPELHQQHARGFRIGIVPRECEDPIARRWGVQRWPSVVFLRGGEYLGTVAGMKNWDELLPEVGRLLQDAPSRRPTIGIPVVSADGATPCH